jgi:hypothetical protein
MVGHFLIMEAPNPHLLLLVLDKSLARALGAQELAAMCSKCTILVPSAFYFEVFDAEQDDRLKTLTGFPEFRRVHLPDLLRFEAESGKPALEVNVPTLSINPKVLSSDWQLSPDESEIVRKYQQNTVKPGLEFWRSVIDVGVVGFTAIGREAARGAEQQFVSVCECLRNRDRIRLIASEIGFAHASSLDPSWIHYRQFQAWALQGLVLWRRYMNPSDLPSDERLEHDLQDLEYLILGLHAGSLATNDVSTKLKKASLGWRFKLLEPHGQLLTLESIRQLGST